jgi:cold shock CspA family protein
MSFGYNRKYFHILIGEDIFVHQSVIHAEGFRSLGDGEPVEFNISLDASKGKKFAENVTGPNGAFVQGSQRQNNHHHNSNNKQN